MLITRWLKGLFFLSLSLVAILALILVTLTHWVDPNRLKPQIQALVQQQTGLRLQLEGPIAWSFYPWLGLNLENIRFNNIPDCGPEAFLNLKKASFQVKIRPLLEGNLQIDHLLLEGLEVHACISEKGQANWTPTLAPSTAPTTLPAQRPEPKKKDRLEIQSLNLKNGRLLFENRQTHQHLQLEQLHLQAQNLQAHGSFPFSLSATLQIPELTFKESLNAEGTFDFNTLSGQGILSHPHARAHLTFNPQIVTLDPFYLTLYEGQLEAKAILYRARNQYQTQGQFSGIQAQAFSQQVNGTLQGTFKLQTQGDSAQALKQNLSGDAQFSIQEGAVLGVDVDDFFAQAHALITHHSFRSHSRQKTPFEQAQGRLNIQQGRVCNPDLALIAAHVQISGSGCYSLPSNTLDYTAQARLKGQDPALPLDPRLTRTSLGIRITGQPPELRYTPDFQSLLATLLNQITQKRTERLLEKASELLGPDLGEGAQDALKRGLGEHLKQLPFGDLFDKPQP